METTKADYFLTLKDAVMKVLGAFIKGKDVVAELKKSVIYSNPKLDDIPFG